MRWLISKGVLLLLIGGFAVACCGATAGEVAAPAEGGAAASAMR